MPSSAAAIAVAAFVLASVASAGAQGSAGAAPALSPSARAKARVLVRDKLSCLGCHRIGNDGGTIGPDLSRANAARTPERVLRMMRAPREVAPGGIMPPFVMRDDEARLVAAYVSSLDETPVPVKDAAPAPSGAPGGNRDGPTLYARYCAACHGAGGNGDGPNARHLPVRPALHSKSDSMSRRTDDRLYDAISAGGAVLGRNPRMPAFGQSLTPAEIRALVAHIRALCGCKGPAWSRDGQSTHSRR